MIISIPERYSSELTRSQINEILTILNIPVDSYQLKITKGNGRNILIKYNNRTIYVIFSRKEASQGRNTFLNQYISTVLKIFVDDDSPNKEIHVYLLDTTRYAETPYMIDTYRMLKSIGIFILNDFKLRIGKIYPYLTVSEWKTSREERQEYNPGNNSTYVLENEDSFTIYGKSFGANGKESSLICCTIAQIAKLEDKSVHLYQVEDNESIGLSSQDIKLLKYYGVNIEKSIIPRFVPSQYIKKNIQVTSRDQATFQFNLLNKYGSKKCFICGNKIEESIIASHIHRITDIDKSSLSWEEKCKAAVDPDNGFWLCANHDKMFEYGLFYFKEQELKISNQIKPIIESLENNLKRTINNINEDILKKQIFQFVSQNNDLLVLNRYSIETIYYSPQMREYLEFHRFRVNGA